MQLGLGCSWGAIKVRVKLGLGWNLGWGGIRARVKLGLRCN